MKHVRVQAEATMYVAPELTEDAIKERTSELVKLALREVGTMVTIEMTQVIVNSGDTPVAQTEAIPYELTDDEKWALRREGSQGG